MDRFEYKILKVRTINSWGTVTLKEDELERQLNELGREGWELVERMNMYHSHVYLLFKRSRG
ncbi:MAG: DUF4177 domain-containing protein [Bacteroidia bacterium]|nr:DUF4177 domain-containing protein [Bacteroidia bacterium]